MAVNNIEDAVPIVKYNGLNTATAVDFTQSPSVALPSGTTINGSPVAGIGDITSSSTTATALGITNTGVYTGTNVFRVTANSATSGTIEGLNGLGLTTGNALRINATAATMTTGRYIILNDATTNIFGIGANGHIHTAQTTAPTLAVTSQVGITAAAITAGASDTCGVITTTGTSTGATILDVTFNKTYTTAPKFVSLQAANAAANMPNTAYYVSAISATGFTITVPAGGTYAATPSWRYLVIA